MSWSSYSDKNSGDENATSTGHALDDRLPTITLLSDNTLALFSAKVTGYSCGSYAPMTWAMSSLPSCTASSDSVGDATPFEYTMSKVILPPDHSDTARA